MIDPSKHRNQQAWLRTRDKRKSYKGTGKTATPAKKVVTVEREAVDAEEIAWRAPGEGRRIV